MSKDHEEDAWTDYLKQRPELNDWYKHCSESLREDKNGSTNDLIELMRNCDIPDFYLDSIDLHDRVVGLKEPGEVFDFDDGEALAYVVGFDHSSIREVMMSSINHVSRPYTSIKELDNVYGKYTLLGGEPYFRAECIRASSHHDRDAIIDAEERAEDMFSKIDQLHGSGLTHVRWDTDEDFFRTICEYGGKANIFMNSCSDMVIDKDYLDHYLLAPKPNPNEVDEDVWHGMSVEYVNKLEAVAGRYSDKGALIGLPSFMFSNLLECFLTRNIENLTFMETIHDFLTELLHDYYYWHCRVGAFDPKVFDMLREYGPSFAGPLFENALSED